MRLKRVFKLLAVTVVGIYLGLVGWMYSIQNQLVYTPSHHVLHTPRDAGLDYEALTIRTSDGMQLTFWNPPQAAVLEGER